jgi:hypothetical protein
MLPHPGAKVPLIVDSSLFHVALYATCCRFCEDVHSQLTNCHVDEHRYLNLFEEPIPDHCDEAPDPISTKRPCDIPILGFEKVNTDTCILERHALGKHNAMAGLPNLACHLA